MSCVSFRRLASKGKYFAADRTILPRSFPDEVLGAETETCPRFVDRNLGDAVKPVPTERGNYREFYVALGRSLREGAPPPVNVNDAIATLERVSGRTLDVVEKPTAAGDVRRTAADTGRIERELGWRAQTALVDGLQAHWEWASVRVAAP